MNKLTIAKFGGSAIGIDGEGIPEIVNRVKDIQKNSKLIVVCSAPLTLDAAKKKSSLTDLILAIGNNIEAGKTFGFSLIKKPYSKILDYVNSEFKTECQNITEDFLEESLNAVLTAQVKKEFQDETRSKALAFSGEVLMGHVLSLIFLLLLQS